MQIDDKVLMDKLLIIQRGLTGVRGKLISMRLEIEELNNKIETGEHEFFRGEISCGKTHIDTAVDSLYAIEEILIEYQSVLGDRCQNPEN